ncbi:hypothetical protein Tco_0357495 [Tanacetum coccineum]
MLVASNLNLMEYVNSVPSGLVSIRPAPDPSTQDEPSVNNVHGSGTKASSLPVSHVKTLDFCAIFQVFRTSLIHLGDASEDRAALSGHAVTIPWSYLL